MQQPIVQEWPAMLPSCESRDLLHASPGRAPGFSLLELVVVLVIVGALAVFVIPKLFDRASFDAQGFYDQVGGALRFARKAAIAQRRVVCVSVAAGTVTLTVAAAPPPSTACAGTLTIPGAGTNLLTAPAGVTLSPAAIQFTALGQAGAGAIVTVTGDGISRTITVEGETGHVH